MFYVWRALLGSFCQSLYLRIFSGHCYLNDAHNNGYLDSPRIRGFIKSILHHLGNITSYQHQHQHHYYQFSLYCMLKFSFCNFLCNPWFWSLLFVKFLVFVGFNGEQDAEWVAQCQKTDGQLEMEDRIKDKRQFLAPQEALFVIMCHNISSRQYTF